MCSYQVVGWTVWFSRSVSGSESTNLKGTMYVFTVLIHMILFCTKLSSRTNAFILHRWPWNDGTINFLSNIEVHEIRRLP